ncbi:Armadillo segment polarity protein [Trichinella pseudospiralis]|uniref:Armadillo segment polarity protein n=1 Tax=Trichinella pseudospiralis TaxID=6337 RepID=A0A0V1DUI6_TRIPS|nr:Armadillo segment polarity protein [Trichinella pseudospiralis]KRY65149.1 Armadillo segment polarity protein [Trichinella pseudospiralis]
MIIDESSKDGNNGRSLNGKQRGAENKNFQSVCFKNPKRVASNLLRGQLPCDELGTIVSLVRVALSIGYLTSALILRTKMSHIPQVPYVNDQVQMPVMGPKDQQTLAWAHQNYIIDSGIQSAGVNTYASSTVSAVSAVSNFIEEYGDPYTPGYTREQIDGINAEYEATRSQRIRAAMFPETIEDSKDLSTTQYDFGPMTANMQRLAEPSQMLKTAVVNIINYHDDAELTAKAIPELIKLLSDVDQVVVQQAAMVIHHLSKRDAELMALAKSTDLVSAIINAMNLNADPELTKYAAGILYNISRHYAGLLAIFQSGGISALVRLLGSPIDSVVFYAITTLHNLLLHQQGSKDEVRRSGGVPKMVALLQKPIPKFLAIVTDCLQNLAYKHAETKLVILASDGPRQLVRIVQSYDYEKLLWTTSRLLKVLSVCPQNKPAIIQAGCMQVLGQRLAHPSQRLIRSCLDCLRNLSDEATKEENVEDLLRHLIQLLGSSDMEVVACCVDILSNLTCNNQRNKVTVCRNMGVEALIRTLQQCATLFEIVESALCTLRHVTCRHPDVEAALNSVRLNYGIPLICSFVNFHAQPLIRLPVAKAALGLLRNLGANPANLAAFREQAVVNNVCMYFIRSFQQVQQAQRAKADPPIIDGVSSMDIVECSTATLHMLSKDALNRNVMRQMNIIPILVQLLYFEVEHIQLVASGALSELSSELEGVHMIEQCGATPRLTELLHSRNESISAYAGATLHRMSADKPIEYRKRLSVELTSSLLRDDGSAAWDAGPDSCVLPDDFSDVLYRGAYDNAMSYDQMHVNSPAAVGVGWDPMDAGMMSQPYGAVQVGMGLVPQPMPPQHYPGQPPPTMNAWYDTDL